MDVAPHSPTRRLAIASLVVLTLLTLVTGCSAANAPAAPAPAPVTATAPATAPTVTASPVPSFDNNTFSLSQPGSLWLVVNKLRPFVPADYAPADLLQTPLAHENDARLRAEASTAMNALFVAAAAEGAGAMELQSAYRSYETQTNVYNGYVKSDGKAAADAESARPGYSEHQSGLAADIGAVPAKCTLEECFGQTTQGMWIAANAWRFGFLLRYPADKTAITGYIYEPWHVRYIGVALAAQMHKTGVMTLEEYFGLPAAPGYAG